MQQSPHGFPGSIKICQPRRAGYFSFWSGQLARTERIRLRVALVRYERIAPAKSAYRQVQTPIPPSHDPRLYASSETPIRRLSTPTTNAIPTEIGQLRTDSLQPAPKPQNPQ